MVSKSARDDSMAAFAYIMVKRMQQAFSDYTATPATTHPAEPDIHT
jgi:hypothetical protein